MCEKLYRRCSSGIWHGFAFNVTRGVIGSQEGPAADGSVSHGAEYHPSYTLQPQRRLHKQLSGASLGPIWDGGGCMLDSGPVSLGGCRLPISPK